jgi:hypothetical protein
VVGRGVAGWTADQPAGEDGMETGLVEKQHVEGREDGIVNVRKTDRKQERAWPFCVARQGRVGRFLSSPSEPLEP